jgi:phospholipid/cholesterol/gamma-HCH transport system substrate-binding protein
VTGLLRKAPRAIAVVIAALLISAFMLVPGDDHTVVAYFSSSAGLYKGDEVRVLGVKVGTVSSVEPKGDHVKVELSVDGSQPIPAGAKAAIVSPSLVNGRFVQLAPVYTGGPKMANGGTIPLARTAIPVSFDEVKKELTDLSTALGPDGKGARKGALNEAITAVDANLGDGSAADLRTSIEAMREAANDLSSHRGDLFSTVKQLNTFTRNLVVNDSSLRGISAELTQFSSTLDDNKDQLATTITTLDQALKLVESFVRDNRHQITSSVSKVGDLTKTVADRSNTLAQLLQTGPNAVEGLYNAIENSAVTGRASLANLDGTAQLVCGAILGVGGSAKDCKTAIEPMLEVLGLNNVLSPADPVTQAPAGSGGATTGPDGLLGLLSGGAK